MFERVARDHFYQFTWLSSSLVIGFSWNDAYRAIRMKRCVIDSRAPIINHRSSLQFPRFYRSVEIFPKSAILDGGFVSCLCWNFSRFWRIFFWVKRLRLYFNRRSRTRNLSLLFYTCITFITKVFGTQKTSLLSLYSNVLLPSLTIKLISLASCEKHLFLWK